MTNTPRILLTAFFLAAGLVGVLTTPAPAQGWLSQGITLEQSQRVADTLDDGVAACLQVPITYQPDCVGQVFRDAARQLANNADYWEAEVALTRVSRNAAMLVRSMKDEDADRLRHDGNRLRAVTSPAGGVQYLGDLVTEAAGTVRSLSAYEVRLFAPIAEALNDIASRLSTGRDGSAS